MKHATMKHAAMEHAPRFRFCLNWEAMKDFLRVRVWWVLWEEATSQGLERGTLG